ncbi:capsular biosynthesis protein [Vibrio diazotrophicus]|uniref:capsular biosynthesis protein n=1 Tax=Vibrio diazotrophicus TaxID=685 RepID=UPI0020CCAE80|nr:capsular biosynthesis protein [Vibrio diazotrophicus]
MKRHTSFLLCMGTLLVNVSAHADLKPKSHIGIAGIDFQSQVGTAYGIDDNVTFQIDDEDKIESNYLTVSPELKAIGQRGEDQYLLMYKGDYNRYQDSHEDDSDSHFMMFDGYWRYGLRHGLKWNVQQGYGKEKRGLGLTEGFDESQMEQYGFGDSGLDYSQFNTSLRYSYGAPKGRGKLDVMLQTKSFGYDDKDHIQIADNDFYQYVLEQEWQETTGLIELFDQYSDDSRFRYSLITNRRHYQANKRKDSNEYYLLFGIKSVRSGKTTIDADIAALYKAFPENDRSESFLGANWNVALEWKPLKHDIWSLHTSQRVKDPRQEGGYILDGIYGISWQHFWWVDRFSTTISYEYETEDYRIEDNNRYDKTKTAKFAIGYDFRPSIRFEMNYQWKKFSSNEDIDVLNIGEFDQYSIIRRLGYDQSYVELQLKVQI